MGYKGCCKEIYVSIKIQILQLILSTRCFSQILIIAHTDRDMSHLVSVDIFNSSLCMTDLSGC